MVDEEDCLLLLLRAAAADANAIILPSQELAGAAVPLPSPQAPVFHADGSARA